MNNTAKSFSIVTGFSIATRLLSFAFKMWMSRFLGAEVVGIYQIAMSVIMMLLTITSGAPTVLSRKIAQANGDVKKQNSLLCASLLLGFLFSTTLCVVLFLCRNRLSFIFSNVNCLPVFVIMLPTLISSTLYASLRSWFWGRKQFVAFSSTELIDEILKISLSVLFASGVVSFLTGAKSVAFAMTIADLACVLLLAILFFFSGGRFAKPTGFKDLTLRTIPLSMTRIITSLGSSLTALVIPKMLVQNGFTMAQATAEYGRVSGMAFPLIVAPITFVSALLVVIIPDVAQMRSNGDLQGVRCKLSSAITFSMLIASVFFAVYLPLGKILGKLVFKDAQAGVFVSYCSLILYPIALAQATTPMLNSLGKEKQTFINTLIGSLIMLPCIFFLPKYIGVYAMAVASGLCFSTIAILNFATLKKEIGCFANFKKNATIALFSTPMAVIAMFSTRLLNAYTNDLTTLIVIVVYIIFFLYIFISAFDIIDICACVKMLIPRRRKKVSAKCKKSRLLNKNKPI